MNARDTAHLQSFRRALQCIERHPELKRVATNSASWKALPDTIARISDLDVRQAYTTQHGKALTTAEESLRAATRTLINVVHHTVGAMEAPVPPRHAFPNPGTRATTTDVIRAARSCAELAKPHKASFVTEGLSPSFIADLLEAAAALESAVADRADTAGSRRGATAAIRAAIARGKAQLANLDAVLQRHMNAETDAEWRQAKGLGRTHRVNQIARPAVASAVSDQGFISAPTLSVALPHPAPPLMLPAANPLQTLIARLLRRDDPAERLRAERPDATVEEIRRLPRSTGT